MLNIDNLIYISEIQFWVSDSDMVHILNVQIQIQIIHVGFWPFRNGRMSRFHTYACVVVWMSFSHIRFPD